MLKHGPPRLFEHDHIYISFRWLVFLLLNLDLLSSVKMPRTKLVFVTGRGGAGFHSPGPALTQGRGGNF